MCRSLTENNREDDYLMLSGIQHFAFCKRQWALIHIEQQWAENVRTLEGAYLHEKVDQPFIKEKRGLKRFIRGLPIKSHLLKFTGICDLVEFIEVEDERGVSVHGLEGKFVAYPVEYKRGKPKKDHSDLLQLTAQAMCLEEMLLCSVDRGALYYGETKHRVEEEITVALKSEVSQMAAEMWTYYQRQHTPKAKVGNHCKQCSLKDICLPQMLTKRSVKDYIEGSLTS